MNRRYVGCCLLCCFILGQFYLSTVRVLGSITEKLPLEKSQISLYMIVVWPVSVTLASWLYKTSYNFRSHCSWNHLHQLHKFGMKRVESWEKLGSYSIYISKGYVHVWVVSCVAPLYIRLSHHHLSLLRYWYKKKSS